ncbi:hypothetical protein RhiirB3_445080 [Rhizophagus irregularis]|nr:hypothetical protein RhiirB3_445080 [Rhizophagus irregularis]
MEEGQETEYNNNIEDFFSYESEQITVPVSAKNPDGICNHKVENGSTTTNMINHLKKIHKISNPME